MLYQIVNGTVSAGGKEILSHIDFEIKGKEKIALVGQNGAGKTTLLRLIAGELSLDRDDRREGPGIVTSRKLTIGILHQTIDRNRADMSIEELFLEHCSEEELYSTERYLYEMECDRLFTGFGFSKKDRKRKLSSFSGGEQTRISLIDLILKKPDILLLDEPTNHLDLAAVQWLENYLKTYDRAVVFVSHDRFFLDQVADAVYELGRGKLTRYAGNYSQYRQQKNRDLAIAMKNYERQQAELQRLEELIRKFRNKPRKAAFARSRKTIMERMEKIGKPEEDEAHLFIGGIEPAIPGSKWMLEAEHLKVGYDRLLLELSLRVKNGQKIGIIGDNGSGKSAFLKTVAGLLKPLDGKCTLGNRTVLGYFDQNSAMLESEKSAAEHFHDLFPALTEKEVRQKLGAYLFRGKNASVKVNDLSGGEKARLVLAELLTSAPNLLLLDEPTNHMDIRAKETLESAFQAYRGTMLVVSHDRYLLRQVADAILVFQGQSVLYYPFGYEHYLERSKKTQGESMAALIQAEDQALIAGLRAVPKREWHETGQQGTEEAYLDWKLRLAGEKMADAEKEFAREWERMQCLRKEQDLDAWKELIRTVWPESCRESQPEEEEIKKQGNETGNTKEQRTETISAGADELEKLWNQWTECCLEWLDIILL